MMQVTCTVSSQPNRLGAAYYYLTSKDGRSRPLLQPQSHAFAQSWCHNSDRSYHSSICAPSERPGVPCCMLPDTAEWMVHTTWCTLCIVATRCCSSPPAGAASRVATPPARDHTTRSCGAEAAEEEESDGDGDDDGDEPAVEPLRQSGVQAVVRGTVRRRRAGEALQKYEQVLTNRDLWVPTSLTHQYRRREIQELQMLQPWGAMLPSDLRDRSGGPPPEEIRQCGPPRPHPLLGVPASPL